MGRHIQSHREMTFNHILDKYRKLAHSERDKGDRRAVKCLAEGTVVDKRVEGLPFVEKLKSLWKFGKAGHSLAKQSIGFEAIEVSKEVKVIGDLNESREAQRFHQGMESGTILCNFVRLGYILFILYTISSTSKAPLNES